MSPISTRSRYGLRFLVDLAQRPVGVAADVRSIALRQEIPESYLAKLAQPLVAAGFVRPVRGAGGGYLLARPAEEIGIFEVVSALEGGISLLECSLRPEACARSHSCEARGLWAGLEEAMRTYLAGKTLASVAGPSGPEYFI